MALVKELEENGCQIKGSNICQFVLGEVQRCVNCPYKTFTPEQMDRLLIDHYKEKGLLDEYPIEASEEPGKCDLCRKNKNDADSIVSVDIVNADMDVKQDLAGTGKKLNGGKLRVELDTCPECRKNITAAARLNKLYAFLGVLVCLVGNALVNFFVIDKPSMLNFFVLAVFAGIGFGVYYLLMRMSYGRMSEKTYMKIFEIPKLKPMAKNGWRVQVGSKFLSDYTIEKAQGQAVKNSR